ncbi:hypothetical protein GVN18_11810 [Pseudomonas sp. ODNR1LW]|nr:hypothetical protein [Pseudomonas sp. ODNR1LW]
MDLLSSSALSERFAGSTGLIAGKPTHKVPRKRGQIYLMRKREKGKGDREKGTDLFNALSIIVLLMCEEKGTDLFNALSIIVLLMWGKGTNGKACQNKSVSFSQFPFRSAGKGKRPDPLKDDLPIPPDLRRDS